MARSFALLVVDGLDPQLQGPLPGGSLVGHPNRSKILGMVDFCLLGSAEAGTIPGLEMEGPKENTPAAFSRLMEILNPARTLDAALEQEILDAIPIPLQPLFGLPTGYVVAPGTVRPFLQVHMGKSISYFWS